MGRSRSGASAERLLGLDDSDKALLAKVGKTLSRHKREILAAWRSSFSELALLPPGQARQAEGLFEGAITRFFEAIVRRDYSRLSDDAHTLGVQLAGQQVPFEVVPFVIQYLSRSYVPFLNRYYKGSQLIHLIELLNLLMQSYGTALASGYFSRREKTPQAALSHLEEVERLKQDFLSIMSHELRTPLSFIVAYASTLEEQLLGELDEPQKKAVAKILEGANRLTKLVDDLMEASQAVAGQIVVSTEPLDLKPLAQSVLETVRSRCSKPGIVLWLDAPESLPLAKADPVRFPEVLEHLLDNACKFTEQGEIRVILSSRGNAVCTEVRDTGIGMSRAEIEKVFATFAQVEPARTHHKPGAGLGLFIAKALVEAMGGSITLEGEKGKGTTARVCLTRASDEEAR